MKQKLGQMLVDAGLLTAEQLSQSLEESRKRELRLGQYLIQEGLVTEFQLVGIISDQLKITRYHPDRFPVDTEMNLWLPPEMAKRYRSVPLKQNGSLLYIAMIDPLDIRLLDALETITQLEVEPVICTEQELNHLTQEIYGTNFGIGDVLDEMQFKSEPEEGEEGANAYVEVKSLQDMAEEAPVVRLVNSILSQAVSEGASDIHISPEKDYVQVRFRVDGRLHNVPAPPKNMILPVLSRLKLLANMDIATFRVPQDGRFTVRMNQREINVRASVIPTIHGENLVLRLLDTSAGLYSLEQLGMSQVDQEKTESVLYKPYGMILSTGPTGSGKTTSLYAILKKINQPDVNIVTLEDPVEYRFERIRQIQLNRKAGMTFASGIRSILRQDPDVIMIGEIRDSETASIAVQSALTGHRVLSTMHANNAAGTITRFLDMQIAPFLVSSVLLLLIAQRLIRKVCPFCHVPYDPPDSALEFWGLDRDGANYVNAKGCFNCMNTGYRGRTGVFETLIVDETIREMILDRSSAQEINRLAQNSGRLKSLKQNVAEKIGQGETTMEEAASVVML